MSHIERYSTLAERYFTALSSQNIDEWVACQTPDAVYNVNGTTPVSGRTHLPALLESIFPKIFGVLNPEKSRIGINWKIIVCGRKSLRRLLRRSMRDHRWAAL